MDRHVLGKRLNLSRRRLHGTRVDQPPDIVLPQSRYSAIQDFLEVFLDRMMPRKKLVQIAVKEAIFERSSRTSVCRKSHTSSA